MTRRLALLTLLSLVAACGAATTPRPGSPEAEALARTHVSAGQHAYNIGHFQDAIDEYTDAYELYPSPVLLFNIGQCYRGLHDWDQAIFYYTGYLRDEPHASNRGTVEQLIREAREAGAPPPTTPPRSR